MTTAAAHWSAEIPAETGASQTQPQPQTQPQTQQQMQTVTVAELYRQMWRYAAGARTWLVASSVMLVTSQLVKLLVPWFTAQAIDTLQRGAPGALASCVPWVAGIFGVYLLSWSLHGPGRVIERTVALRVRRALTDRLYAHLSEAPLAWHAGHHPAQLAHRVSQSTQALSNFTQSQFIYLQNAVNLAGPLLALCWLSGMTGAAALLGVCAVTLTIVSFDRALMRLAEAENRAERGHAGALMDCLANITTVVALRLQLATRRLLTRRLDEVIAPLARSITVNEWKWCAVDLLSVLFCWGLVAFHAWKTAGNGALLLGSIFMVYQYAQQAGGVVGSLASNLQNFGRMRTDFASAAAIWTAPQTGAPTLVPMLVPTLAPTPEPAAAQSQHSPWQCIDLCSLSYRHPGAAAAGEDEPKFVGLHQVSIRLHAGERIALVGPSGCGKSTMLRVLAGLCTPSGGHIEIDGVAVLGLRDLRRCATLIPQDAQMFEATLRENIAFDSGLDEASINEAARIASLDGVIAGLPLGLETPVAQGGASLSGGQRQRVSLTRGVIAAAGSSVLLLDEPTSALDPVTERVVYDRLFAAFAGTCIVASVHRPSLLGRFDRVVLMDHGHIVDCGTTAELAERQQMFREMLHTESASDGEPEHGAQRAANMPN